MQGGVSPWPGSLFKKSPFPCNPLSWTSGWTPVLGAPQPNGRGRVREGLSVAFLPCLLSRGKYFILKLVQRCSKIKKILLPEGLKKERIENATLNCKLAFLRLGEGRGQMGHARGRGNPTTITDVGPFPSKLPSHPVTCPVRVPATPIRPSGMEGGRSHLEKSGAAL